MPDVPQVVPRSLGPLGKATSDGGLMVLRAIEGVQGQEIADDVAAGYCDAAARFWHDEGAAQ